MSSCLIVQTHNEIFIGADTALSTYKDGKTYRLSLPDREIISNKIFYVGNMLVYCSGFVECVPSTINYLATNPTAANIEITQWLRDSIRNPTERKDLGFSVLLCEIINGNSLVRSFASAKDYICEEFLANDDTCSINVLTAGFNGETAYDAAMQMIAEQLQNIELSEIYQKVFDTISCNEVGGYYATYRVSDKAPIFSGKIQESDIDYFYLADEKQIISKALAANMGTLTAGTITSDCVVNVGTDATVGDNLSVGRDILLRGFGRIQVQGTNVWLEFDPGGALATPVLNAGTLRQGGQLVATQEWVLQQIATATPPPPPPAP